MRRDYGLIELRGAMMALERLRGTLPAKEWSASLGSFENVQKADCGPGSFCRAPGEIRRWEDS